MTDDPSRASRDRRERFTRGAGGGRGGWRGGGGAGQGGTVCRTAAPCADMHLGCSHVMHPELGISVTLSRLTTAGAVCIVATLIYFG